MIFVLFEIEIIPCAITPLSRRMPSILTQVHTSTIPPSPEQKEGDLGKVAALARTSQNTLFKPKPLTIKMVFKTFRQGPCVPFFNLLYIFCPISPCFAALIYLKKKNVREHGRAFSFYYPPFHR